MGAPLDAQKQCPVHIGSFSLEPWSHAQCEADGTFRTLSDRTGETHEFSMAVGEASPGTVTQGEGVVLYVCKKLQKQKVEVPPWRFPEGVPPVIIHL